MADISTHDRDGADAHAVDLVEDRRHVDAVAAAELHLAAAYGGAEYVHGREEVVAHLVDALADLGEDQDDDVRPRFRAVAALLRGRVAHGAKQDLRDLVLSLDPRLDALGARRTTTRRSISQAPAVSILPTSERSTTSERKPLRVGNGAHRLVDRRDTARRPVAGKAGRPVRPPSSRISTRGSRLGVWPSPVPASGWALISMVNRLNPSRHGCHFDRHAFGPFRSR